MNAKHFSLGLIVATFILQNFASAALVDHLTQDQIARLKKGEQIVNKEKVSGSPWAKLTIYQVVEGTPEEAAAVTMDWGYKIHYTQGILLKSDVKESSFGGAVAKVDYAVKVPFLGSENFTLKNSIKPYDDGKSYEVDFVLIAADRTKSSQGTTMLETFDGNTLMQIVSQTDPPHIPGIGMAESNAVNQTLETSNRFVKQVKDEKASDPQLLDKQIHQLEDAMTQLQGAPAATSTP